MKNRFQNLPFKFNLQRYNAVNSLFCKREKRQAAEWLLDEAELSKFGVTVGLCRLNQVDP